MKEQYPFERPVASDMVASVKSWRSGVALPRRSLDRFVLLRIRRRIAEGKFDPANLNLFYFESSDGESRMRRVHVDRRGAIDEKEWPKGLFADDVADSVALARASLKGLN